MAGVLLISTLPADSHWLPEVLWVQFLWVPVGAAAAVGAAEIATAAAPAAKSSAMWVSLNRMATSFDVRPDLEWNPGVRLIMFVASPRFLEHSGAVPRNRLRRHNLDHHPARIPTSPGRLAPPYTAGIAASGDCLHTIDFRQTCLCIYTKDDVTTDGV